MAPILFSNVSLLTLPGRVMTPRGTTEQLVDRAVELVGDRPARVADVGTGSGAIAVALAVRAPQAEVWATDTSPAAVALARANARRHGVACRVHVLRGDLCEPLPSELDLVLANLPYLPGSLRPRVESADLDGEPPEAVFAPGDGLGPYRRLLENVGERLAPDGRLIVQYRAGMFEAGLDELSDLRRSLEASAAAAA
jgi:release factor glutamine methyltransferase